MTNFCIENLQFGYHKIARDCANTDGQHCVEEVTIALDPATTAFVYSYVYVRVLCSLLLSLSLCSFFSLVIMAKHIIKRAKRETVVRDM